MIKVGLDSSTHRHRDTKVRERGLALIARFHRLFFFPQKKKKKKKINTGTRTNPFIVFDFQSI